MINTDKLRLKTPVFVNENIEKPATQFPHCVIESAGRKNTDYSFLQQDLINDIEKGNYKYYSPRKLLKQFNPETEMKMI